MKGLAPKPDGVLQSHSVSGCNSFTGDIYILLSVSGTVLAFFHVFFRMWHPLRLWRTWADKRPGLFSRCVLWCGCILTSTNKEIPPTWSSESWAFPHSLSLSLPSQLRCSLKNLGQEVSCWPHVSLVCVPRLKESFPLVMKCLACLGSTLFWTLSAAPFVTFVLSVCQDNIHLA